MPNIDSLSFDLTDCELISSSNDERMWRNSEGLVHTLTYANSPVNWPFDLTDHAGAKKFYGTQCASVKGVMLSLDVLNVNGIEMLTGVFKYHSPKPDYLGFYYVGIIWIPFSNFNYQINVEGIERGFTGFREAAIASMNTNQYPNPRALEGITWPKPNEDSESIEVSTVEEMFERRTSQQLVFLPSDHEQFDSMFKQHPLSQIRARLEHLTSSIKIDKTWWQSIKPFRLRH